MRSRHTAANDAPSSIVTEGVFYFALQERIVMSDISAHIQAFDSAYAELFRLIDTFPADRREQPGACGVWSVKDVLAHCSGWIVEAQFRYDDYDTQNTQKIRYDFDEFNARSVSERTAQDWAATEAELRGLVRAIVDRARALPAKAVEREYRYGRWLKSLADDCREHTEGLRTFLREGA
jgi:hypothetical protein